MGSIITKIEVTKLFDKFSYTLPNSGTFSNTAILYGDNGVGKSTILRLVFHLLSAAENRGHRTALSNIAFENLSVSLSGNIIFNAERLEETSDGKIIKYTIFKDEKLVCEWLFYEDEDYKRTITAKIYARILADRRSKLKAPPKNEKKDNVKRSSEAYIENLKSWAPTMFYVSADRHLNSDTVADSNYESELQKSIRHRSPPISDLLNNARETALSQALSSASIWIHKQAVQSTNKGTTNVHSEYTDILKHLSNKYSDHENKTSHEIDAIIKQLDTIEAKTKKLEEYELASYLDMSTFKSSLNSKNSRQKDLSLELIKPYISSIVPRLQAQEQIYQILDRFVNNLNEFLTGKKIIYKLTQGFSIVTETGKLEPAQLSSGEQQLLLMFCYALIARDTPSVFMIDEPEISLNVKWQRQLLQSLAEITSGSSIQFILASHSLELISQHRDKVVKLEN